MYIKLPTSTGHENFLCNNGPDLIFVRGGSGFGIEKESIAGPWYQYFFYDKFISPNVYDRYFPYDNTELTEAHYSVNDPGVYNTIGYSTENFITHQKSEGPDFWAKRRAVLTFQNGANPGDVKHYEIMDFLPITRPQLPALPNPFPVDVARFAREMTKYVELLQVYNDRLRDSLDCRQLVDLPDPNITPVVFTDDVIAFTKVYEVSNENLNTAVMPQYLLPAVDYPVDIKIKFEVGYGLQSYIRYRCFSTSDFTIFNPLKNINLMWHALPTSYRVTVYFKRK